MNLREGAWSVPSAGRTQPRGLREVLGPRVASPLDLTTGRILVADDDPCARRFLRRALEAEGHEVLEAHAGAAAIATAAEQAPDLVLLAARGKGPERFETCRRMRCDARTRGLAVLLILETREIEDRIEGTLAGGDDFLGAPLDLEEVTRRVRNSVWARRRMDALVAENERLRELAGLEPDAPVRTRRTGTRRSLTALPEASSRSVSGAGAFTWLSPQDVG